METLDTQEVVAQVARELPSLSAAQTERALLLTLSGLMRALPQAARHVLRDTLAPPLRAGLERLEVRADASAAEVESLDGLAEQVWRDAAATQAAAGPPLDSLGRAREAVEVLCGALARRLEPETRERIQRSLPAALAELFAPAAPNLPPPVPPSHVGREHTLAGGRPPSAARPLSEAAPGSDKPLSGAVARRTQSGTLAEENPHARTKLSSAQGLTQEREHESLAEARPPGR